MADPDREFDAIVIGEYERAFYASQYALMAPLFEHYGVQMWMPEAGGRVNFQAEADDQMMTTLGMQSKREITRTRAATWAAGRRTGTGSPTRARTRTRRTRRGGGGRTAWSPTQSPRRW